MSEIHINLSSRLTGKVVSRFIDFYENHDLTNTHSELILSKTFSEEENDIIDAFLSSIMKGYIESGQTSDLPSIMNPMTDAEYIDSINCPVNSIKCQACDQRNEKFDPQNNYPE